MISAQCVIVFFITCLSAVRTERKHSLTKSLRTGVQFAEALRSSSVVVSCTANQRRRREGVKPGVTRSETPGTIPKRQSNPCQGVAENAARQRRQCRSPPPLARGFLLFGCHTRSSATRHSGLQFRRTLRVLSGQHRAFHGQIWLPTISTMCGACIGQRGARATDDLLRRPHVLPFFGACQPYLAREVAGRSLRSGPRVSRSKRVGQPVTWRQQPPSWPPRVS